jgi:hypothetical protein
MTPRSIASLAICAVLGWALAAPAGAEPQRVRLDTEATIGGVDVACTGIGQTKDQPRWKAYPVRVEFADSKRNYLAGEVLSLADPAGAPVLEVVCEGPWVLLRIPAGKSYRVEAHLTQAGGGGPRSAVVKAPSHGQATFVITFPDAD